MAFLLLCLLNLASLYSEHKIPIGPNISYVIYQSHISTYFVFKFFIRKYLLRSSETQQKHINIFVLLFNASFLLQWCCSWEVVYHKKIILKREKTYMYKVVYWMDKSTPKIEKTTPTMGININFSISVQQNNVQPNHRVTWQELIMKC